ncbi:hypothetical protein T07_1526 [Trichinella nelsoni]|uniref:Uncharacterized protein n=1 Tax=Trichinella nelsoni TaxID=6336 RepID=A0A0V0RYX5_9BILA|nr:hypothetical protein T07_1526 [Trichinella nelsoni]
MKLRADSILILRKGFVCPIPAARFLLLPSIVFDRGSCVSATIHQCQGKYQASFCFLKHENEALSFLEMFEEIHGCNSRSTVEDCHAVQETRSLKPICVSGVCHCCEEVGHFAWKYKF